MTDHERLRLAEVLLCDDLCADAEMVAAGLRQATADDALTFARRLERLYTLVHPAVASCQHADWEAQNEREYIAAEAEGAFCDYGRAKGQEGAPK